MTAAAYVDNCCNCPMEADGYCLHPGRVGHIDTDDVRPKASTPEGCPLRKGPLTVELRIPELRK